MTPTFKAIAEKLETETAKHPYSDVIVNIKVHDGQIRLIEFTVTEKMKPAEIAGGQTYDRS